MCGLPPLRPDARGLVALSTSATVTFVARPLHQRPTQWPQVHTGSESTPVTESRCKTSMPTRRSGIWCGLVRLHFRLTYAMAHLRHPIAMRRQLRFVYSFSPARHIHSRRRFHLEQLSCPAPRMRLPLACLTRQSFLMCLLLSGHHITTPPARNERSNRGACSPRTLDSRRSLDAHESPAVAGCPSCLAQTYAS